ncbi:HERV-H LTR-associating protein 1 [Labrus mixtus]|uniref:HERV-H LTR-associating protein 1 n=1 Tax=Labrus mixtus TaxID=508554 RepID=UPI0029C0C08C|nr:HERV-H LTR-associating protein 1 [Labrus mixtus]
MAGLLRATPRPRLCFIICVSSILLLILFCKELRDRQHEERHKRDLDYLLNSTEIPAEHIDPAAIDLTPLVNTLINTSQSGSRQLFSLLSVTSYSSLALHKLTLLVYNISSIQSLESNVFRRRFCYCVTNETNDLTDFTAILLDVMGNSTSYLQEIFKSASILSVSQRNNSDCIYICVMAGKMGREVPELWEVDSIIPLFNQTIVEGPHRGNVSSIRLPVEWSQLPTNLSHVSPSGMSSMLTSRVHSTAHVSAPTVEETAETSPQPATIEPQLTTRPVTTATAASTTTTPTQTSTASTDGTTSSPGIIPTPLTQSRTTRYRTSTASPTRLTPVQHTEGPVLAERTTEPLSKRTTIPSKTVETEKPGCPWRRPDRTDASASLGSTTTVSAHKLQPCVFELCKFFSQCLCRPFSHKTRMKRYCDDSHLWYEKHTSEVCRRVRRVSFSRNLKQRCLMKMCNKL